MNARAALIAALLALWSLLPFGAFAQGFAGLGQDAQGFELPDPAFRLAFPRDHGPHPGFRIEWWYVTAVLSDAKGRDYGVQWTLFRNALAPGGAEGDQIWMGHAAVSAPDGHRHEERFARGGNGHAGVTAAPFRAFIDEWSLAGPHPNDLKMTAQGTDFAYDLTLIARAPFVPQGENGYSVKSEAGLASHYYSQPFYEVAGTLTLPTGEVAVTGRGWLDREWSSQPLAPTQTGWDWISLHLAEGDKLMGYRLRDAGGDDYIVGTWIDRTGVPRPLNPGEITMTPVSSARVAGRDVPVVWDVAVPALDIAIRAEAIYPDSWMPTAVPYWEGPVRVGGSHEGKGYLEMTGYE